MAGETSGEVVEATGEVEGVEASIGGGWLGVGGLMGDDRSGVGVNDGGGVMNQ